MTITIEHDALINISTVHLREFIQDVYAISTPSGVDAVLEAKDKTGPLTEEEIDNILARTKDDDVLVLDMAVENGRGCHIKVFRTKDAGMAIKNYWPGREYPTLLSLLKHHNILIDENGNHQAACPCRECRP